MSSRSGKEQTHLMMQTSKHPAPEALMSTLLSWRIARLLAGKLAGKSRSQRPVTGIRRRANATILGTQGSRQVSAALWDGSSLHLAAQARVQCSAHFTVGATVASVCMAGGLS
ncbi:predicted protein [Plenodomus lingam JN3]|uniref:Predicted protein n=1 Tax=Leptosphaeria maculans (strain JN3 / isolate v23.1.3 / race Av1-4-5-6-7-8) TaxID=985895 RepID=E4ZPM1_LEPMJ|nr:predicted protein [Plenodomus lingam JN3]CBX93406.1 predicted protein [Plenodomus lingam JN3]